MANLTRLDKAILFATRAHAGQIDRDDTPHIFHSLRVMERVRAAGGDEDLVAAAVLHDVIEDTDFSSTDILKKFGENVARIVISLTKMRGEAYHTHYIERVVRDCDASFVKYYDLLDNLARCQARVGKSTAGDLEERYQKALDRLGWQRRRST
jgi:(p)ppGpp synthase/HD superfamily hydrolase